MARNYPARQTGYTWDEYDDNDRWEGIFWMWERRIIANTGGPQSEMEQTSRVRQEPQQRAQDLYYSGVDRRIHLFGAQEGWIEVGQIRGSAKIGEVRMLDTDRNGFFDTWEYDLDNDGVPERTTTVRDEKARMLRLDQKELHDFYTREVLPEAIAENERLVVRLKPLAQDEQANIFLALAKDCDSAERKRYLLDLAREKLFAKAMVELYRRAKAQESSPNMTEFAVAAALGESETLGRVVELQPQRAGFSRSLWRRRIRPGGPLAERDGGREMMQGAVREPLRLPSRRAPGLGAGPREPHRRAYRLQPAARLPHGAAARRAHSFPPARRLDGAAGATAPGCEDRSFELGAEIPAYPAGDWGNYAKAAAQALVRRWKVTRGVDALVSGDLPMAAGLSSSSAMVVASALALLDANGIEVDRIELAELMAAAEHYVGTRGGGMDQAICLGGRRGHAALIEFAPLKLMPVAVPADWRFLIAHSMVRASKSAGAREHYNQCVADCRAAAAIVGDFRALVRAPSEAEVLSRGQALLDDRLFYRFRHQITEGRRVYRARDAMTAGDAERFGALMLASHTSMRDDYLISCSEVDHLAVAMESGAIGARMTGAGFGGFVVALTDAARVDSLMGQIEERFYSRAGSRVWPPDTCLRRNLPMAPQSASPG